MRKSLSWRSPHLTKFKQLEYSIPMKTLVRSLIRLRNVDADALMKAAELPSFRECRARLWSLLERGFYTSLTGTRKNLQLLLSGPLLYGSKHHRLFFTFLCSALHAAEGNFRQGLFGNFYRLGRDAELFLYT